MTAARLALEPPSSTSACLAASRLPASEEMSLSFVGGEGGALMCADSPRSPPVLLLPPPACGLRRREPERRHARRRHDADLQATSDAVFIVVLSMSLDLEWDLPLQHRRGAARHLCGIDVFHDFEWLDEFPDERTHFRNGQRLAERVRSDCPAGKSPALLLTLRHGVEEGAREAGDYYVLVVNLHSYLENADPDAAAAYLANRLGPGLTRARRFSELIRITAGELAQLLELRLNAKTLLRWAGESEERLALLRELGNRGGPDSPEPSAETAIAALRAVNELDEETAAAVADLISPETDVAARLALLRGLTADIDGRYVVGEVFNERARDRLADARVAAAEFEALLDHAGETQMQEFLELNPWLLGLHYAHMRARHPIIRGTVDFILERFDGFHDLLELKGPNDRIFETTDARVAPPSGSGYRLSRPVAQALAQVHVYRHALRHEDVTEELFGLPRSRDPRVIIVIGKVADMTEHSRDVLRELNRSLHRLEIVPFDVLSQRARAILNNVERYLLAAESEAQREA